ncbi:M56 family metallopeptidase, partial [Staphylococcus epidermidis]|uniref:M56 family metallopeptidase n=1 Tax=Staphylococcus epidermidis TaxID=1282 RepID=UPI0028CB7027
ELILKELYVVFKMIFWFNGGVYISKRMMENECEKVCDRKVLKILNGDEDIGYGEWILKWCILKCEQINNVGAEY